MSARAATPARLGFRMPAEWEPHVATWLAWPHKRSDWPGKFETIPWVMAEIVRALAPVERVRILVPDARRAREAQRLLRRVGVPLSHVDLVRARTDRSWTRDSLPTLIRRPTDGARALVDWHFNGWARYPDWRHDARLGEVVGSWLGLERHRPMARGRRVVLEGGAIDVNGRGTLVTTEQCLLSPVQPRNPGLGRRDIEVVLRRHLGVRTIVWLAGGIEGDDTHGHVDDVCRFVDARTVVVPVCRDRNDPNFAPLAENRERLRHATDQDGRPLRVVTLPMPAPLHDGRDRLPASYANFYVANEVVLVPTFNDEADRIALARLARLFRHRRVIGIHAVDLLLGLGTIHCLTQQEPA